MDPHSRDRFLPRSPSVSNGQHLNFSSQSQLAPLQGYPPNQAYPPPPQNGQRTQGGGDHQSQQHSRPGQQTMYDRGNGSSSQGGRYPGPPPFPPSTYANEHHPYHPQPSTSSSAYQQQSRPPPHAYPANAHAPPRDPGRPQSSTAQPTHAQPTSTSRTASAHGAYHARSPSPGSDQSDEPQHKRVKREGRNDHRLRAQAQEDADADDDEGDSKSANGGKGAARSKQAGAAATAAANKKRAVQSCSECRRRKIKCDKQFPCSPCVLRNDQDICREVDRHTPSTSGCASSSDVLSLSHRLAALESVLKSTGVIHAGAVDAQAGVRGQAPVGGHIEDGPKKDQSSVKKPNKAGQATSSAADRAARAGSEIESSTRGGGATDDESIADRNGGVDSETEGAAITLEHLAFGRRKDEPTRPPGLAARSPTPVDPQVSSLTSRRASVTFAEPPFPALSFSVDQPPLHPSAQHPGSTSTARSSISNVQSLASSNVQSTETRSSGRRRSSIINLSPPNPSESSPASKPSLPGSTPFTLLNLPSKVGMGSKAPVVGFGGPLGATKTKMPPLGSFTSKQSTAGKEPEGKRVVKTRDLTDPSAVFTTFFRRSEVFMEAFLSCLPGQVKERALIKHYFARVEWIHHCLHVPTFSRECEEFWAIPFDQAVAECSASWIGLYLIIMCLSLHFLEKEEALRLGFTEEEQSALPATWFAGCRGALWQSDFLTNHSLECLQIIILSGVYLNNEDRADAHWGILGSGIKIAQMMGINRLGAEDPNPLPPGQSPRRWSGRWESLVTREIGRRVWWQLVFLDWSLSPSYGYACTIHPDQMNTAFPGNIRDEDLIDGQPFRPVSLDIHTPMSYQLTRLRLIETAYQIIYVMNHTVDPHPPYEAILRIDEEFKKIEDTLPPYYKVTEESPMTRPKSEKDEDLVRNWEKIVCNLSLQTRGLRLHRPYLTRGYKNPKYAYSTKQCVRAARAALGFLHEGVSLDKGVVFLEKWWITLFYAFISTVVLLIDLLYTARDKDWEEKLQEVKRSLKCLRRISDSSPARGTIKVIEALLLEVEGRPVGPVPAPRKRGLSIDTASSSTSDPDSNNGLQRAVRRLVQENEVHVTAAASPANTSTTPVSNPSADSPSPAYQPTLAPSQQSHSSGATQYLSPMNPGVGGGQATPGMAMPSSSNGGGAWLSAPMMGNGHGTPMLSPAMQQFNYTNSSNGGSNTGEAPGRMNPGFSTQQFQTMADPFGGTGVGLAADDGSGLLGVPSWNNATNGMFMESPNSNSNAFGGEMDSDLMSQIFSLPDLDWVFKGPNAGPSFI